MAMIGSLLYLVSAVAMAADPAPRMTVVVTPNPVVETQNVQLRIEIETGQAPIVFQPSFEAPDFIMVGSQPQYGGVSIQKYISGQSIQLKKTFFEYVLAPKRPGILFIRNLKTKVGSSEVRSLDVMVKVLPDKNPHPVKPFVGPTDQNDTDTDDEDSTNPAAPGYGGASTANGSSLSLPPDDVPAQFNSDFTVHASISKRRAYVGQPIVVEYWLYDFGGLRQADVQKWPTFNGFWKDDLEITSRFEFDEIFLKNRMMRRAFLGRYALFGIKPGKINIDRLVVRGEYVSNTVMQGFFQMQKMATASHGSQDLSVELLPLPKEGRPEKFSGAVGQFFLKLEADKTTVAQHDSVTLTLTAQGAGNFQAIDSISPNLPSDFELFESNSSARANSPIGVRNELESFKKFTFTAVPRKAGVYTIPPIDWWYFDPEKEAYVKASTSPLEIQVTENANGAQKNNSYSMPGAMSTSKAQTEGLRAISAPANISWQRGMWITVGLLLLANLWLASRWLSGRAGALLSAQFRDPFTDAKVELASAERMPAGKWLNPLEDSLYTASAVLLGTNPRGITRLEFESLWREKGLPPALFHRIALLFDRLDKHRFSMGNDKNEKALRTSCQKEALEILREGAKAKKK